MNKKGQIEILLIVVAIGFGILVLLTGGTILTSLFGGGLVASSLNSIPAPIWIILLIFIAWAILGGKRRR